MPKPRVLFLCTANSARSQMAEALMRHYGGDRFEVASAGTDPQGVHSLTVRVLEEAGLPTAGLRSKHLDEFAGVPVDHLIVVCAAADATCPAGRAGSGAREFWPFDDPAAATGTEAERLARFREIRKQIAAKVKAWLALGAVDGTTNK